MSDEIAHAGAKRPISLGARNADHGSLAQHSGESGFIASTLYVDAAPLG